ncbi:TPA: Dam family site-specific DNA-(adenine-N6)-methyltransferase [Acinetobacter baumannii]|uniref:DNA adenine methylase n=1 Tax=Acinetobacter baumannii TaxID=470 RepID=UPI0008482C47|nr:Dam family site-specific DNA-(adenine-N6)-methyltransferase [Acinetobacter baumannii]AOM87068.1 DNA methyltransferase [Acinetobacter baumannii]HEO1800846.1 Dam family site-specific DNA-(adenine-N6)-methyltransferase [Acinetobacter baumannii]
MNPFLAWTGGKRWLGKVAPELFNINFSGKYIEPFLGGASFFYALQPKKSILGDTNKDLIITYRAVRDHHLEVVNLLKNHHKKHCKEYYYLIRNQIFDNEVEIAAQFIYLNRTCFNSIYRVNLKGKFNVPIGTKTNVIQDQDRWEEWSKSLKNAELVCGDFENLINKAKKNDLLFLDPPYTVRHNNNGFIKYNEVLFSWADQERLAKAAENAQKKGVKIIITNANHESIRELYSSSFNIKEISRYSSIAANGTNRNKYEELIITCNI